MDFIFDMIFPNTCIGCGCTGTLLCSACASQLQRANQTCPVCGHASADGAAHAGCTEYAVKMHAPVQIFSAFNFHDPIVQAAVHDLKYHCVRGYAKVFAGLIVGELKSSLPNSAVVTPVPIHRRKLAERGFNQSDLIAQEIAMLSGLTYKPLLTKARHTKSQTAVTGTERREQLRGTFTASSASGLHIVLVDDVCTTSSTLRECAKILYESGASTVSCLTFAKD